SEASALQLSEIEAIEPELTTPLFDAEPDVPGSPTVDLDTGKAEDILRYAVDQFSDQLPGDRLIQAISFQKEASVILDMLIKINPNQRFFTIDNGNLFPETLDVWRAIEAKYDTKIEVFRSLELAPASIREQATPENAWAGAPDDCCGPYKVASLEAALLGADAWITGLRREQSHTRAETRKVQWDAKNGLWKVCPLADWSERDVWNYIFENDVPYNKLHDQGYASIGCTNCTQPGEGREGRWAGSDKTECGLHG
ncbi:MAG: phosphoadenylyl-sulfate reductase, partial [Solirubrobacterales bacterium]